MQHGTHRINFSVHGYIYIHIITHTAMRERHTVLDGDKGIIYNVFVDGPMEKLRSI
jgi:hypothetical protein